MKFSHSITLAGLLGALSTLLLSSTAFAQAPAPAATPAPVVATIENPAPRAQAYVRFSPPERVVRGVTLVPSNFLRNYIGAAIKTVETNKQWRISYFGQNVDVFAGENSAIVNGTQTQFPAAPQIIGKTLYVPWVPLAKLFGFKWSRPANSSSTGSSIYLMQYQATYIEAIRHATYDDHVRVVIDLSNATRVTARYSASGMQINLSAARRPGIPSTIAVGDVAVPKITTTSGNWKAVTTVRQNYAAPATWYTLDNPPRIVIDVKKIFEQSNSQNMGTGFSLRRVFRGTGHGPVRLYVATIDPKHGWRVKVEPAGYGVLQRRRVSQITNKAKAPLGVNGGFFATDGAAVGAVKVNGKWIRLPWKGRTAIGFKKNGDAMIGNLQVSARVKFSSGLNLPIRDLNGWPDRNSITAITRRFAPKIALRPGEIGAVVSEGIVTSTPGSGSISIPADGFVLVANGGAIPELQKVRRGLGAKLDISSPIWSAYPSALGAGPRLLTNGQIDVRNEGFRSDVTNGLGPRTAIGLDKNGRYIIVVADGRRSNISTGLTLTELAYTMQKYGAVNAINLDGGGSTALFARGRIINHPSDGSERRVANALVVTR